MGKRLGIALAIAVVLVLVAQLAYRALFSSEDKGAETAQRVTRDGGVHNRDHADAATAEPSVQVTAVRGTVERLRDGKWLSVSADDALAADDVIRTGPDGRVSLDVDGVAVDVDGDSEVALPVLTRNVSRIRLGQGRVSARVPDDRRGDFGVAVKGSDAVAETGAAGEFAVQTSGRGEMAIATTKGKVKVTAKGKSVDVTAGQQTTVPVNKAPRAPTAIPKSLLLKVARPRGVQRHKRLTVSGRTTPGSIIKINGVAVKVDDKGQFSTVVALREGRNQVRVQGRDVAGNEKESRIPVSVDSQGPNVGGNVTWGKKK